MGCTGSRGRRAGGPLGDEPDTAGPTLSKYLSYLIIIGNVPQVYRWAACSSRVGVGLLLPLRAIICCASWPRLHVRNTGPLCATQQAWSLLESTVMARRTPRPAGWHPRTDSLSICATHHPLPACQAPMTLHVTCGPDWQLWGMDMHITHALAHQSQQ